ncbi:hypothetical protein L3049_05335 [Labilibaculum sp. DW002]|uniref:Uncharacterized protein n=1 Tax=Paralabilibaculum antarcticum TaxID=2912572 RepID=A0ABT5VPR6_9BACT|nr:hypothetical protein [Labilibaculum sp. DW002]MDE5417424.1 hypothetical protein [Labilibaculum sp. DW002]
MKNNNVIILIGLLLLFIPITIQAQLPAEIDTSKTWYLSWSDDFDYENSKLDLASLLNMPH